MRKLLGSIPDNLNYVQRPPKEIGDYWEHDLTEDGEKIPTVKVRETFVVDASNPKTLETAMKWAKNYGAVKERDITVSKRANDPIDTLEILGLDIRSEGGRAWKVIIHGTYYVDLREDVLLDALKNGPGVVNKELRGPFLWCRVASQLKLVRVGSRLHKAVVAAGARATSVEVVPSKLEVGDIYENRKGEKFWYLGLCDHETYPLTRNRSYDYIGTRGGNEFEIKKELHRKEQLWVNVQDYWKNGAMDFFTRDESDYRNRDGSSGWEYLRLEITKKKTVTGKVGHVDVPTDYLEKIRDIGVDVIKCRQKYLKRHYEQNQGCGSKKDTESSSPNELSYYAWLCTIRAVGEPEPQHEFLKPLYDWVAAHPVTPAKK